MRIAIVFILGIIPFLGMTQRNWTGEFFVNPYMPRIGDFYIEHGGLNLYEFKDDKKWQKEVGVRINLLIFQNLQTSVGIGFKDIYYDFTTPIESPLDPAVIIEVVNGDIRLFMIAPSLTAEYDVGSNISVAVGVEMNIPLHTRSTFTETELIFIGVIRPPDGSGGVYIYKPSAFVNPLWSQFILPELRVSYAVSAKVALQIGAKLKPYGRWQLYGIRVDGFSSDFPTDELYSLQSTIVYNKMIMPYIGIKYIFGIK